MNKRLLAYFLLILATALWGIGGPIIKNSFNYISPLEFLFWRFTLVSLLSLPVLLIYLQKNPLPLNKLPKLILLALLGTVLNLGLSFVALDKTTVVEAAIIGSLTPMFVALASAYFLREPLGKFKRLGIVFAIAGTVVAVLKPLIANGGSHFMQAFEGNLLILLSGLTWVSFVLLSKRWENGVIKPFHIVSISSFIGAACFYVVTLTVHGNITPISHLSYQAVLGFSYMAIFGSLIAFTAYSKALTLIEASQTEVFGYLANLWSVPLAIIWLKEDFDYILVLSAFLIICGVVIAERRERLPKNLRAHHLSHRK